MTIIFTKLLHVVNKGIMGASPEEKRFLQILKKGAKLIDR